MELYHSFFEEGAPTRDIKLILMHHESVKNPKYYTAIEVIVTSSLFLESAFDGKPMDDNLLYTCFVETSHYIGAVVYLQSEPVSSRCIWQVNWVSPVARFSRLRRVLPGRCINLQAEQPSTKKRCFPDNTTQRFVSIAANASEQHSKNVGQFVVISIWWVILYRV